MTRAVGAVGGWVPTSRLALAVGTLLVASLAAVAAPELRAVVVALDAALFGAVLVDALALPRPSRLGVRRTLPERAGLGAEIVRRVRLDASAAPRARGRAVRLFEEFPAPFEVVRRTSSGREVAPASDDASGGPDEGTLPAAGELELTRVYRGTRRGKHTFGHLRVRVKGPLGLVERQTRLAGEMSVAVEPPLGGLSRTLRLAAAERWRDLGVRRLRRRGGLTEFESLRDYVPGDDVRWVDWKAFARRGRPTVRNYQEERGQELVVLVDRGRRMGAPSEGGDLRGWTKLDHALDAALELAAVALQEGDRVGFAAFDAELSPFVPPARGSRQLARLARASFDLAPSRSESDLGRALAALAVRQRRRALVLVLSDVADPLSLERQRHALALGARHHRVILACLDDPELRRVALGEREAEAGLRAAAYELVRERERALAELARSGAPVIDSLPAESAARLLACWLDERRAGR